MSTASFLDEIDGRGESAGAEEDDYATIRNLSRHSPSDQDHDEQGNYSSRLDEILGDDGSEDRDVWNEAGSSRDSEGDQRDEDEEEEEEGFVYTGKDAAIPSGGYRDQLKDVLDGDELSSVGGVTGRESDLLEFIPPIPQSRESHEHIHLVSLHTILTCVFISFTRL